MIDAQILHAIQGARKFVADELEVRERSYLPDPGPDEHADLAEARLSLEELDTAAEILTKGGGSVNRLRVWLKNARDIATGLFFWLLDRVGFEVNSQCNDCGAVVAFTDRAREHHCKVCPFGGAQ